MSVREKLLSLSGKRKYKSVTVTVEGEPLTVWFATPPSTKRDEFEESLIRESTILVNGKPKKRRATSMKGIRAKLIAACAVQGDNDPRPLFDGPDDVERLGNVADPTVIDALFETAQSVSGMTDDDVKELTGN